VTLALVAVGTLVTTYRVGMADKLWPTAPWHLLLIRWAEPRPGFLIEHTHRILGYLAGTLILVQTVWLWWTAPSQARRWGAVLAAALVAVGFGYGMRLVRVAEVRSPAALVNVGFGVALLGAGLLLTLAFIDLTGRDAGRWQRAAAAGVYLGVIVQGMFGGLRVYLNELRGPELAVIHGVFAQVVFALTALLALMTTAGWNRLTDLDIDPTVRRLSLGIVGLVLVQIVFGGLLRHFDHPAIAQRLHPLLAFGVLFVTTWAAAIGGPLRRKAVALLALVLCQAAFGVETWLRTIDPSVRYQSVSNMDVVIRTGHVLLGFGIFASAALLAARAWKPKLI
jgi:heme A synthase